jgi:hypothetical protein
MTKTLIAGAFALTLMASGAYAQSISSDATANFPNGPAGSESVTKTQKVIGADGSVTQQSQSYDKTQTYSSGDGALSAHSTVRTNEEKTVTPPAPVSTTTSTTTTETVR